MTAFLMKLLNFNVAHAEVEYVPLVTDLGQFTQTIGAPLGQDIGSFMNQVMFAMIALAVVLAVFGVIRGGYVYMTSGDSADKKSKAKGILQAAFGGLLLAVGTVVILSTINPEILKGNFGPTEPLEELNISKIDLTFGGQITGGVSINNAPIPQKTGEYVAEYTNISNPEKTSAAAYGVITINGKDYAFISGGYGRGYIPAGTYTVTINQNQSPDGKRTTQGMVADGYGYAFNLNDTYDDRVGGTRTLLRIHPDGGNPGTNGCIGIQGNYETQQKFHQDLSELIRSNNGSYTITIGNNT